MKYNNNYESKSRFECNKCSTVTDVPPTHKNATCIYCNKGRLRVQTRCRNCGEWFSPDKYGVEYCKYECKVKAQSTGKKTFRETNRIARNAQSLLGYHVRQGNITKPSTCERCGADDKKIEGSHDDYSKVLEVEWLCKSCHVKKDKKNPLGVTSIVK